MKAALRQRARELGFDDCRFTTAAPPESAPRFESWLAKNRHGEMAYLQRNAQKRVDPQRVLSGARSIIALMVSYAGEEGRISDEAGSQASAAWRPTRHSSRYPGVVARYARYADYHEVIGERLKSLSEFVNQLGGSGTRSLGYVDTGPLLERDLGQRAGLGFIGKHTNLISRKSGNWIFLAEILTTLDLPSDAPEPNRCGSCIRCISACPTNAITSPFQLDARRCISYLTIELKGSIPLEFRSALGNRIYGCDDCLAVCPWNRFAREGNLMKSHARQDLAMMDLIELLSLDDAAFKKRFANSPMLRAKRKGLLRNVCVALGNIGDENALPELERVANGSDSLIPEHARWAIAQILERKKSRPSLKAAENLLA